MGFCSHALHDGATNEWYVSHVVYNDSATNQALYTARTSMGRPVGASKAHGLHLESWCVRPGNYSLDLRDYHEYLTGWFGGGRGNHAHHPPPHAVFKKAVFTRPFHIDVATRFIPTSPQTRGCIRTPECEAFKNASIERLKKKSEKTNPPTDCDEWLDDPGLGVFLSDANDCQIMHATAENTANSTYYFTAGFRSIGVVHSFV